MYVWRKMLGRNTENNSFSEERNLIHLVPFEYLNSAISHSCNFTLTNTTCWADFNIKTPQINLQYSNKLKKLLYGNASSWNKGQLYFSS